MFNKLILALLFTVSVIKSVENEQPIAPRFIFMDKNGAFHEIQRCFVDPTLRNIPTSKLEKALPHLAIRIGQLDNGEYTLHAHVKGLGGFLLTGVVVYQASRIIGHTGIWVSTGIVLVGAACTGPQNLAAAYVGALATIPSASAAVESGSLALGVAASWIPGLP